MSQCPEAETRSDGKSKPIILVQGNGKDRSHKDVDIGVTRARAMIDSGVTMNILRADLWRKITDDTKDPIQIKEYLGTLKG